MDLSLDFSIAQGYKSPSQIARLVTEDWAQRNLFCLSCSCDCLTAEPTNTRVRDYSCSNCGVTYQLKSTKGRFGASVSNSAYAPKIAAIEQGRAPHYAFLQYSPALAQVTDLFLIPGHLLNAGMIARRKPLSSTARRSGWVGSNILLGRLPSDVRVTVISTGIVRSPEQARADWRRYSFLQTDHRSKGGWGADVLLCVSTLSRETGSLEFTLQEFYQRFAKEIQLRYPSNQHVEAKIRQQLQVLRDGAILTFLGRGRYRLAD